MNPAREALSRAVNRAIEAGAPIITEIPSAAAANSRRAERGSRALDHYTDGGVDDLTETATALIVDLCHMIHEQTGDYPVDVLGVALHNFNTEREEV